MPHQLIGKLKKAAMETPTSEGVIFLLEMSEQSYDHYLQAKVWTNYKVPLFCKSSSQADYFRRQLVYGAVVCVSGDALIVRPSEDPTFPARLELVGARLVRAYADAVGMPAQVQEQVAELAPAPTQAAPNRTPPPQFTQTAPAAVQGMNDQGEGKDY